MKFLRWAIAIVLAMTAFIAFGEIKQGSSLSLIVLQITPTLVIVAALCLVYVIIAGVRKLAGR